MIIAKFRETLYKISRWKCNRQSALLLYCIVIVILRCTFYNQLTYRKDTLSRKIIASRDPSLSLSRVRKSKLIELQLSLTYKYPSVRPKERDRVTRRVMQLLG